MRYKVSTVHGEMGTVHHVVDSEAPEGEQPAIIASFSTAKFASQARALACRVRDVNNKEKAENAKQTWI